MESFTDFVVGKPSPFLAIVLTLTLVIQIVHSLYVFSLRKARVKT